MSSHSTMIKRQILTNSNMFFFQAADNHLKSFALNIEQTDKK